MSRNSHSDERPQLSTGHAVATEAASPSACRARPFAVCVASTAVRMRLVVVEGDAATPQYHVVGGGQRVSVRSRSHGQLIQVARLNGRRFRSAHPGHTSAQQKPPRIEILVAISVAKWLNGQWPKYAAGAGANAASASHVLSANVICCWGAGKSPV